MDMCGVYRNNCESCLLARDPYCGWAAGSCQSIYHNRYVARAARCFSSKWAGCGSLGHAHVFNIPFPGRLLLRPSPHQRQIPLCPGSAQRCSAALHLCRALSFLQHLCCGGGRNQWVSYILSTQIPFSP